MIITFTLQLSSKFLTLKSHAVQKPTAMEEVFLCSLCKVRPNRKVLREKCFEKPINLIVGGIYYF